MPRPRPRSSGSKVISSVRRGISSSGVSSSAQARASGFFSQKSFSSSLGASSVCVVFVMTVELVLFVMLLVMLVVVCVVCPVLIDGPEPGPEEPEPEEPDVPGLNVLVAVVVVVVDCVPESVGPV